MYIPTQEERYAKKGVVSLILCVVVPSCLYVSLLSKQLMMVRGHEWEAVMKLFLAFTYPLAALFAMTGIPFFWWSVGISLAVHAGIVAWLKTTPLLSPKKAVCIALCLGMLDFLFVKLFPFPAQIMGYACPGKYLGYSILYRQTNQDVFNAPLLIRSKCAFGEPDIRP